MIISLASGEDMASLGIQSGHYTLSASTTKRITISWNNNYDYRAEYARLYGASAWMPSSSSSGQYLEVSTDTGAEN